MNNIFKPLYIEYNAGPIAKMVVFEVTDIDQLTYGKQIRNNIEYKCGKRVSALKEEDYYLHLEVHFDSKNNLKEVYMTIPDKETDEWDVIGSTLYSNFLFPQCHTLLTLTEFEELIELAKIKLKEEEKCTNSDTNC